MPPKRKWTNPKKDKGKKAKAAAQAMQERQEKEDKREQEFTPRLIENFNKNYLREKPTVCACVTEEKRACVAKGRKCLFTPVWCRDTTIPLPANPQKLTDAQKRYAMHLGLNAVYKSKCDGCLDRNRKLSKTDRDKKEDMRAEGIQVCNDCGRTDPKLFSNEETKTCITCMKRKTESRKGTLDDGTKAAAKGDLFCGQCRDSKPMPFFQRKYRHVLTKEEVVSPTVRCVPCLDKEYIQRLNSGKKEKQKHFALLRKEKLDEFDIQTKAGNCTGCNENCPLNLKKLQKELSGYLKAAGVTNHEEEAERIFCAILEWDHKNPLSKTRHVNSIHNTAERLKEIKKCQLLCTFCHRLKTYLQGDNVRLAFKDGEVKQITRTHLKNYLELKIRKLEEQGGECVGPGIDGVECPFKRDFAKFKEDIDKGIRHHDTKLSMLCLMVLMYDFDHLDIAEKLNCVSRLKGERMETEANKCNLKCCLCHRWKTMVSGDFTSWVAVMFDSNEECRDFVGLESRMTRDDSEWRLNSF